MQRKTLYILVIVALFLSGAIIGGSAISVQPETAQAKKKKSAKKKKAKKSKKKIANRQNTRTVSTVIPPSQRSYLNVSITFPDLGFPGPVAYKRMKSTGAKFTRVIIFWDQTVPKAEPRSWNPNNPNDPNYDWTFYDHQIREALKAGLTPMIQLFSAPGWAERCNVPNEPGICNPDPDDFERFTRAATLRYSGLVAPYMKVNYWQPWNEPNLHVFFKPQKIGETAVSPMLYRELLDRFARVVRTSSPDNKVVGGGLAPLGGKNSVGPLEFTRQVLCMQGRTNPKPVPGCTYKAPVDFWSTNPYTTGGPTQQARNPDDVQFGDLKEMVRLIDAAHRAGRIDNNKSRTPVWITEFSWDSKPDPNGLSHDLHTRWLSESMYRAWAAGIENYFWFCLRDWDIPGASWSQTLECGLYFRGKTIEQDKAKPALTAFEFPMVAFREKTGIKIWGRTKNALRGVVAIEFSSNGKTKWKKVLNLKTTSQGVFYTFIRTSLGKNNKGFMRASFKGKKSLKFSLTPVKNFYQPPFG